MVSLSDSLRLGSALRGRRAATMASADSSRCRVHVTRVPLPSCYPSTILGWVRRNPFSLLGSCEASRGKTHLFPPIRLPHLRPWLRTATGTSTYLAALPTTIRLMRFLFVRPGVRLRLPSDSASRQTPLPSAMHFPLQGVLRGRFTPLEMRHARRTRARRGACAPLLFSYQTFLVTGQLAVQAMGL